jgi:hypothetical protein
MPDALSDNPPHFQAWELGLAPPMAPIMVEAGDATKIIKMHRLYVRQEYCQNKPVHFYSYFTKNNTKSGLFRYFKKTC